MDEKLDLKTLKAKYPDVFEAVCEVGAEQERKRVMAHLKLGQAAGDEGMKIALKAVADGTDNGPDIMAEYVAANMNRSDQQTRQQESDETAKTVSGAPAPGADKTAGDEPDLGDKIVAILDKDRPKKQAS